MRFFFNNLIWSIILLDDFIHDNDDFGSKDKFVAPFACKKSFWGQHIINTSTSCLPPEPGEFACNAGDLGTSLSTAFYCIIFIL